MAVSNPVTSTEFSAAPVDCHFHVFAAHQGEKNARYRPAYASPLSAWAKAARSCGVGRGVLVQTSFMGTDNTAVLQAVAQDPLHLRGVVVLDTTMAGAAAAAAQVPAMHARGVRGLRLNLVGQSTALGAHIAGAGVLWDALLQMGWHLQIHTERGVLPEVLRHLPAPIPLVLDHFGRPASVHAGDATLQAVSRRAKTADVYVKLSAAYRLNGLDAAALARIWRDILGPQRLLWGSDWPCTNFEAQAQYPGLRNALSEWLGDETLEQQVLVHNPGALYWA